MALHVIIGYGPVGRGTAALLAGQGHEVRVITRSAGPVVTPDSKDSPATPDSPAGQIRRIQADGADPAALTEAARGAEVLYNCACPPYHRWPQDWPPLAAAVLTAAERTGAVLATVSNLYGYGPVTGAMTEDLPLRATGAKGRVRAGIWRDALAAHEAGRVRATEVRPSDYLGPGAQSPVGDRIMSRLLAGRAVQVPRSADTEHTWTYIPDVARLLVAVGADERAWGRPWHVPSNPPRSQRQVVADLSAAAGLGPVPVREMSPALLRVAGIFVPVVRELPEVSYQTASSFIVNSAAAQAAFSLQPTPWDEVVAGTVAFYQGAGRAAAA
jgi:nucleoside-diphosphate-sugar epimerase